MSKPNRLQRHYLGNKPAREAVRQRKRESPWEQACLRVRELGLPHSCVAFVDAIAARHRELGQEFQPGKQFEDAPVYIGYGDGTPAEKRWRGREKPVQRPRHPPEYPPLTEVTGYSRRSMFRARKLVEGHEVMKCGRDHGAGSPVERTYTCRSRTGEIRGTLRHLVGIGGCDRGGQGMANGYWPWGVEDPDPPLPKRGAPQPDGRPTPRSMREAWDRSEAQRRRGRPATPRGP